MLYWKWPQFWKKWGSRNCDLKVNGLYNLAATWVFSLVNRIYELQISERLFTKFMVIWQFAIYLISLFFQDIQSLYNSGRRFVQNWSGPVTAAWRLQVRAIWPGYSIPRLTIAKVHFDEISSGGYCISSYSFRENFSFLNLEIQRSQYISPKVTVYKCAETIQEKKNIRGWKLYEKIRYMFHYF
jgi:hypothetical protein